MGYQINIQERQTMTNELSLCIPRIPTDTAKEYVYDTINGLSIGRIQRLTEIPLKNDPSQKRVLLKIKYEERSDTKCIQKQLLQRGSIKLVHDMPWYWKIYLANNPQ
mgnify:CR=1 FL=1